MSSQLRLFKTLKITTACWCDFKDKTKKKPNNYCVAIKKNNIQNCDVIKNIGHTSVISTH